MSLMTHTTLFYDTHFVVFDNTSNVDVGFNFVCLCFQVMLEACQDREHCSLVASTKTFRQDPCPGTRKYLEVAYKCRPSKYILLAGSSCWQILHFLMSLKIILIWFFHHRLFVSPIQPLWNC